MYEAVLLLALLLMKMSFPPPNIGPKLPEHLQIAVDGLITMLLNGVSPSLLMRENMNALEVEP